MIQSNHMRQLSNPDGLGHGAPMDRVWDRIAGFAMRHERPIAIVSVIWFAFGCALAARFVALPDWLAIPYLTDRNSFWLTGGWNALFWGYVHPRLDARRKRFAAQGTGDPAAR